MTKPSAPAQEWACVPRGAGGLQLGNALEAIRKHRLGARGPISVVAMKRAYEAMFAAAPDSGMVPVPRELLDEARNLLADYDTAMASQSEHATDAKLIVMANYGDLAASLLRILLSRAGNKGDGR